MAFAVLYTCTVKKKGTALVTQLQNANNKLGLSHSWSTVPITANEADGQGSVEQAVRHQPLMRGGVRHTWGNPQCCFHSG